MNANSKFTKVSLIAGLLYWVDLDHANVSNKQVTHSM